MRFSLVPMTERYAREIASWRYTGEYVVYNASDDSEEAVAANYLKSDYRYFAALDENDKVAGFCCYGLDAQVPGGAYSGPAIDVGLGLHPDYVGKGLGASLLACVLSNPAIVQDGRPFRATIARFNQRSLRLFEKMGFVEIGDFSAQPPVTGEFVILMQPNGTSNLGEPYE